MLIIGFSLLVFLTICQVVLYYLYNGKYHPYSKIVMPNRKCKLQSNHLDSWSKFFDFFPFLTVAFYKTSEESPSDPEPPTNANDTNLSQPANQSDSQPQELKVTPLHRKPTSRANLEVASGANPFQIEMMKATQAGQSKEMDKSDIEMTILSADTHSTNSS